MSDENSNQMPTSLDALLNETKGRFEDLFDRQMTASPPPVAPATARSPAQATDEAQKPASDAPTPAPIESVVDELVADGAALEAVTIDLNKRFTIFWASEVLERDIQNGRATVRCQLTVGDESLSGPARVHCPSLPISLMAAHRLPVLNRPLLRKQNQTPNLLLPANKKTHCARSNNTGRWMHWQSSRSIRH